MSRNRVVRFVGAVVTVAVAAGCATTVSGQGRAAVTPARSDSSSADFPSAPATTVAPAPTSSAPTAPTLQDITDAKWRVPPGFVKSHAFHPVTPLERHYQSAYLVPSNERRGLDVISITLYKVPAYIPLDTTVAEKVRVRYYNDRTGARPQSGLHVTTVDGRPAIQETAIERRIYKYGAWYVFGTHHVLLLTCQVDQQVNKIIRGCRAVLHSLKIT